MHQRRFLSSAVTGVSAVAALTLMAPLAPAQAADPPAELYEGHVEVDRGEADDAEVLEGQVFDDVNQNSKLDEDERGVPGVAVSNGIDVVQTDGEGTYELPVRDNMTVSVTQPPAGRCPSTRTTSRSSATTTCRRARRI